MVMKSTLTVEIRFVRHAFVSNMASSEAKKTTIFEFLFSILSSGINQTLITPVISIAVFTL